MQCLVINLDRSPDRLAHMQAEFARIGLSFRRARAVDALEQPELTRDALPVWQPAAHLSPVRMTASELCCALSHRACWEIVAAGEEPYGAIFEDDIVLADGADALLADAGWIPAGTDLVKLETFPGKVLVGRRRHAAGADHSLSRLRSLHLGCAGYILSRDAARRLAAAAARIDIPVDHMLFDPLFPLAGQLRVLQLMPALCVQDRFLPGTANRFASLLDQQRRQERWAPPTDKKKKTLVTRLRKELQRAMAKLRRALTMRRLAVPFEQPQSPVRGAKPRPDIRRRQNAL